MDEVSIHVAASPERIWELVTDITRMGEWSPECTGGEWAGIGGPIVGARFKGHNQRKLLRWTTHCEVKVAEAPNHFMWAVDESGANWGFRMDADDGGTRLTEYREELRPKPWWVKVVYALRLLGRDRDRIVLDGMRSTIERVKAAAEA